jgi:hypothetical protein
MTCAMPFASHRAMAGLDLTTVKELLGGFPLEPIPGLHISNELHNHRTRITAQKTEKESADVS